MGLLGTLFKIVGALVLVVIGLGAYLYFSDYEVNAHVTSRSAGEPYFITVTPDLVAYDVQQDVTQEAWSFVCEGYRVTYRVNSGFTQVFDTQDRLVWDSENGVNDAIKTSLTPCEGVAPGGDRGVFQSVMSA